VAAEDANINSRKVIFEADNVEAEKRYISSEKL